MATAHRATYLLQHGTWQAKCRECGFEVSDTERRRAASQFRVHIREVDTVIDLRNPERVLSARPGTLATG